MSTKYIKQKDYISLVKTHNQKIINLEQQIENNQKLWTKVETEIQIRQIRFAFWNLKKECNTLNQDAKKITSLKNPTWKKQLEQPWTIKFSEPEKIATEVGNYYFEKILSETDYNNLKNNFNLENYTKLFNYQESLLSQYNSANDKLKIETFRKSEKTYLKEIKALNKLVEKLNYGRPINCNDQFINYIVYNKQPKTKYEPRIKFPIWILILLILFVTPIGIPLSLYYWWRWKPAMQLWLKLTLTLILSILLAIFTSVAFYVNNVCDLNSSNLICENYQIYSELNDEHNLLIDEATKLNLDVEEITGHDVEETHQYYQPYSIIFSITATWQISELEEENAHLKTAVDEANEEREAQLRVQQEEARRKAEEEAQAKAEEEATRQANDNYNTNVTTTVDPCNTSGHRQPNAVVDVGYDSSYATRDYYAYTNEYGQLTGVYAPEIIIQNDDSEPVNSDGRYCSDEADVSGTEESNLDQGHVIADSLGGVSNAYNITPQDSELNRYGAQADMEEEIRSIEESGGSVTNFVATITYPNDSTMIPSSYSYTYEVNGNSRTTEFNNSSDVAFASRKEDINFLITL